MLKLILAILFSISTVLAALNPETQKLWKGREQKENLEKALKNLENESAAKPTDIEVLTYLSKGYFLMGEFHTEDPEQKKSFYKLAMTYGQRALDLNPDYKAKRDDDVEKAIQSLTIKEVEPLFWYAASLGKHSKAVGIMSSLKYKNEIVTAVKRVEGLKPDFHYGAVPRYWGVYYAVVPGFAGGDMKKSKKQFEQAIAVAPEYQGTKVLRAENYWVLKGDEKEFEKDLKEVIESKNDDHPEIGPENKLEKLRAQKLLSQKKELF